MKVFKPEPFKITFSHIEEDGATREVGRFFMNDEGKLDFYGRLTESGKIFIEHVLKDFNNAKDQ